MAENLLSIAEPESPVREGHAIKFVLLLGLVSLFSDMVYEGARSIIGPYLSMLGASGAAVGFIAGGGELVGYLLRLVTGYLIDRNAKYWLFAFLGYLGNLLTIPLLAFVGSWPMAAALVMLERTGKAVRTPARDAMISYAGKQIGMGKGFGLHQSLDQVGAMIGPLIAAVVLYYQGGYRFTFILLALPAIITLAILWLAQRLYPRPQELEINTPKLHPESLTPVFWIYLGGSALVAAGYADFSLIAFHFEKSRIMSSVWIPLSYVLSMGVGSIIKAMVGTLVPRDKRASAYGLFNTVYGIAWFLGSVCMGILYDISLTMLVVFSLVLQLSAMIFIVIVQKKLKQSVLN